MSFDSSGPFRSVRSMARPLELARAIRSGPCTDAGNGGYKPVVVPKDFLAGHVPVVLDQVCDWWNTVPVIGDDPTIMGSHGHPWPDGRLEPMGRLPWPRVWAEWIESDRAADLGEFRIGIRMCEMQPRFAPERARSVLAGSDVIVRAEVAMQLLGSALPVRIGSAIYWGARATGESFKVDGKTPFVGDTTEVMGGVSYSAWVWELVGVWRLFTALLQVKGTEAVDTSVPRHVRRDWARIEDGPAPWVTYKTLAVRLPARPGEQGQSAAEGPPPGVPLHLVRAFIADYRNGKGLFGKYKQLVWMPAHLRGHARLGAIAKTYEARVSTQKPTETPVNLAGVSGGSEAVHG